jgi:hypothetical protein
MFIGSEKLGAPNEERAVALLPSANRSTRASGRDQLLNKGNRRRREKESSQKLLLLLCVPAPPQLLISRIFPPTPRDVIRAKNDRTNGRGRRRRRPKKRSRIAKWIFRVSDSRVYVCTWTLADCKYFVILVRYSRCPWRQAATFCQSANQRGGKCFGISI